jgi:hypothetical protein
MSGLRDAIALEQRALAELQQSRSGSAAWADERRHDLDRQCLDLLQADGRRLLESLRKAAHEIAAAEGALSR